MSEAFGTTQEKQAFLKLHTQQPIAEELSIELPCTTQDCLNTAKVALISYNPQHEAWELIATCVTCIEKLREMYGEGK